MLVTFSCNAYANITMFGDVAVRLLELMGHSGTCPAPCLQKMSRLRWRVWRLRSRQTNSCLNRKSPESVDDEPTVSLSHRALPVIELLKAAAKAKYDVMWDKNN